MKEYDRKTKLQQITSSLLIMTTIMSTTSSSSRMCISNGVTAFQVQHPVIGRSSVVQTHHRHHQPMLQQQQHVDLISSTSTNLRAMMVNDNDETKTMTSMLQQQYDIKVDTFQPTPIVFEWFKTMVGNIVVMQQEQKQQEEKTEHNSVDFTKNIRMIATTALLSLLVLGSTLPFDTANAAMSGGRMGGSFSRSSGGGGGSSRMMSPSRSTYRGGGGGYGGYGGGGGGSAVYYSRPSIIAAPIIVPYGGYGYGNPGVISYNRGPGLFDFLFLGAMGLFVVNAVQNTMQNTASSWFDNTDSSSGFGSTSSSSALGNGMSTIRVSFALNVPNRDDKNSILSILDTLSQTAKTDQRVGVQNLTSQVALELLRRKSSITSAYTHYEHYKNVNQAQRAFNTLSVTERSKFEKEIISKFGGVDYSNGSSRDSRSLTTSSSNNNNNKNATMVVVTIILSIAGDSTKVPKIRSIQDVEETLRKIATDVKVDDCLTGAEILWTPEDRSETLSLRDIIADYPELISI